MPTIEPARSVRNLTPISTELPSALAATTGVADGAQTEHGQVTGTGVLVMAIRNVEVFKNTIKDNNTANINITTFSPPEGKPISNPAYNQFVSSVYIHDNEISGGGQSADVRLPKVAALAQAIKTYPDILYDGVVEPKDGKPGKPEDARVCIENNGEASFLNYDAAGGFKKMVHDVKAYKCSLPVLTAITLPNAGTPQTTGGSGQ